MKRALILAGGWEGHHPQALARLFADLLGREGFSAQVSRSLDDLADGARLKETDLVVPVWTLGKISEAQEKGLSAAVQCGTGIAGFHGGMCDAFRESVPYQFMTGGQFVAHPGGVIDYEIRIERPDDPILKGIRDFRIRSEQYYMHVDPANEVLATTTFTGEPFAWTAGVAMPVVWKKRWGEGRVFYASYGHSTQDFEVPEALEIVKRGMLWASRTRTPPRALMDSSL